MDGTLLDTLRDLELALNYSLSRCGYPPRTTDEVRSYIGDGIETLIMRAMPDGLKQDGDFISKCMAVGAVFKDFYIEHGEDNTVPYDGILELLRGLKSNGIKTAVVSNKIKAAVDRLNESRFCGLIDVAVGDGMGVALKPAPDMLLYALDELGAQKESAVFVGDGETDIVSAKKAGLPCISVAYGYRSEEFLMSQGAQCIAHDAKELASLLGI